MFSNSTERLYGYLAVCFAILFLISFYFFHVNELKREYNIPLAFSEISKIEQQNTDLLSHNILLPAVNDILMKVFEAYNNSNNLLSVSRVNMFATELEYQMSREYKWTKYNIPELSELVYSNIDPTRRFHLPSLTSMHNNSLSAYNNLNKLWNYNRTDYYRTEYYTETETYYDSEGKSHTRTVTKSREVYDYSIHDFNYNYAYAKPAYLSVNSLRKDSVIWRHCKVSTIVGAENELAMDKHNYENKDRHTDQEYFNLSSIWWNGSSYKINYEELERKKSDIDKGVVGLYMSSIFSGRSHRIRTNTTIKPAVKEYDDAMLLSEMAYNIYVPSKKLYDFMIKIDSDIKELNSLITIFIKVQLDKEKSDISASKLQQKIVALSKDIYSYTFSNGLDVRGYRIYMVILLPLIISIVLTTLMFVIQEKYGILKL